jgi:hypothetical protein
MLDRVALAALDDELLAARKPAEPPPDEVTLSTGLFDYDPFQDAAEMSSWSCGCCWVETTRNNSAFGQCRILYYYFNHFNIIQRAPSPLPSRRRTIAVTPLP